MQENISDLQSKPTKQHNFTLLAFFTALNTFAVDSALYPLDTIKSKIQFEAKEFRTFLTSTRALYMKEGLATFYRGYSTVVLTSPLANFLWFYSYETLNKLQATYLKSNFEDSKLRSVYYNLIPFISGGLSEIGSIFFSTPLNIIKLRMQVGGEFHYTNIVEAAKNIYNQEGLLRFYRAAHLSIMINIFQTGIQFWSFEHVRTAVKRYKNIQQLSILDSVIVSACTSAIVNFFINPIDLINTRYQMANSAKESLKVKTILWHLINEEGFKGLFKGFTTRSFMFFLNMSLYVPVYDYLRHHYGFELH